MCNYLYRFGSVILGRWRRCIGFHKVSNVTTAKPLVEKRFKFVHGIAKEYTAHKTDDQKRAPDYISCERSRLVGSTFAHIFVPTCVFPLGHHSRGISLCLVDSFVYPSGSVNILCNVYPPGSVGPPCLIRPTGLVKPSSLVEPYSLVDVCSNVASFIGPASLVDVLSYIVCLIKPSGFINISSHVLCSVYPSSLINYHGHVLCSVKPSGLIDVQGNITCLVYPSSYISV